MPEEKTELSKFSFWLITSLLGAGIIGFITWAHTMNQQMVEQQIAMAEMKTLIVSIDTRLKDSMLVVNRIHDLESTIRSMRVQTDINTQDLLSRRDIRFNMPDYDKYVRPVQDDLLKRITVLETKIK